MPAGLRALHPEGFSSAQAVRRPAVGRAEEGNTRQFAAGPELENDQVMPGGVFFYFLLGKQDK